MKYLTAFIISLCMLVTAEGIAKANTYYFSSSTGDDSRTITQAQNPATPWQSINKLNSLIPMLAPGDSILFKRGDTFYGSVRVSVSGLASLPIVFSAYGNGNQPVITGLTALSGWTDAGGGIQAANCSSCKATDNVVVINGVLQRMGRFPNTGYLTYQSYSGDNSITGNQLAGGLNWQGAEVVIRKNHWIIDRNQIISQSGNTINYQSASVYSGTQNFGFFIQNDPRTLDTLGEWYFNPAENNMMVYFGSNSSSQFDVRTSTVDTLVYMEGKSNIVFENLAFEGANKYSFLINWSNDITIQNCSFDYSGNEVIRCVNCKYFTLTNSSVNHTLNNAIDLGYSSSNSTISNNIIKNTGYIAGMGGSGDGTYTAIIPGLAGAVIENNEIDSTGYSAITFDGDAVKVEENYINTFCFIKDDGGGIYTYTGYNPLAHQQRFVKNNIIVNGIGAPIGANGRLEVHGIYMDDNASQVTITGNTVANCNSAALVVHNAHNLIFDSNTVYNSAKQFDLSEDNNSNLIRNIISSHNIFFSKSPLQPCMDINTVASTTGNLGAFDSNYYCMALDTSKVITTYISNKNDAFSLPGWQSYSSQDSHSKGSPVLITDTSKILFKYNATSSVQKILLNGTYMGVDGTHYSNSITLRPFSSVILIKISNSNSPPVANAGSNQTITLPLDSVTLDGSASYDPDGTIAGWKWTKQSGSSGYVIRDSAASKTNVSGLTAGTYVFTLTVTDNQGADSSANVTIIVNKLPDTTVTPIPPDTTVTPPTPPNQPPVAKTGSNQTITLPLDSVTLDGSASYDPDGTIVAWKWAKQSGPSGYVIRDSAASKANVSELIAGTYIFTLTVTDNQGASSSANVTVIVNKPPDTTVISPTPPTPPNQPPVAKAGSNQTITLPMDSVTLDGSASYDPDGTITGWRWTNQSGPSGFVINDSTDSKTIVSGLTAGTYIFTLTVTDNLGADSSANVTVIVNKSPGTTVTTTIPDITVTPAPPPNQPPVAKAGSNQTITLPMDSVTLDGSASYDPDGMIAVWKWAKQSGPSGFVINDSTASKTTVSGLTAGTYIFTLTVTDNRGATSSINDTVRMNQPPVANAGTNTNLFLPVDSAILNGSASYDPDGKIVSWSWMQVSGPSVVNILNADSALAQVDQLENGVYVFALSVTDNNGAKDTSEVTIGVYQKPDQPPVANAGNDITIVLPQSSAILDGTASFDPDGILVKYRWAPISGPTQVTMLTPDSSACIVSGLQMGTYDFQLTVTDNNGLSSTATISVYILPGEDTSTTTFSIYPNPAHDQLNVKLNKEITGLLAFRIIDVNGRILKIYQFGQLPMHVSRVLDISNLAPGMYFVQLIEDNQFGMVAKMIKY